jgi:hypothetical protein
MRRSLIKKAQRMHVTYRNKEWSNSLTASDFEFDETTQPPTFSLNASHNQSVRNSDTFQRMDGNELAERISDLAVFTLPSEDWLYRFVLILRAHKTNTALVVFKFKDAETQPALFRLKWETAGNSKFERV